jgi:hypothetical protein
MEENLQQKRIEELETAIKHWKRTKRIVTEICRLQGDVEDRDLVDQAFKDWYESEDFLTNLVEGEV